ncbi:uncharacterized protein MYCFIDRAFT_212711 [Pseudocercospora fijiensis CIRAD86]|uniref:Uncharacterized protein n=1 Tax=Pseudocercospora fijiensis (strain CIRAD86) TaxID=383855 RepID=M3AI40_PSEFD|nr:uncharacterized protein MYCFIDRAFT_212711 [Pseudocercospora fijiensis CIRAD86]EME77157.1 hypothetical protein MYCFIDRAFT_212711 [Pseudocercospora fijiensis CIRAD86]
MRMVRLGHSARLGGVDQVLNADHEEILDEVEDPSQSRANIKETETRRSKRTRRSLGVGKFNDTELKAGNPIKLGELSQRTGARRDCSNTSDQQRI